MAEYDINSLQQAVQELQRARITLERLENQHRAELEANPQIQELKDSVRDAKTVADRLVQVVHYYALEEFEETGEKHPHPAVEIKEADEVIFDKIEAFHWCIKEEQGRAFLVFNEKAFRAAMLRYDLRPEFVTTVKQPKVFIDQEIDL